MTRAGDHRRSRRVLRLIAADRIIRGVLLLAAGVYLLFHVNSDFGRLAERVLRAVTSTRGGHTFIGSSRISTTCTPPSFVSQPSSRSAMACSSSSRERVWLDQLWAEYLTVIATSLLIPLELYELVHRPTVLKAGGLIVNFAIVAYLVSLLRRRTRTPAGADS